LPARADSVASKQAEAAPIKTTEAKAPAPKTQDKASALPE
jgi:hypothetical protein